MAKAAWLTLEPASGSGNGSISNKGTAHTGRLARTTTVTVTATGVSTPATYQVTQKAKTEFAQFNDGAEMSAPKAGGTVTVQGKSNSKILTFAWVGTVEDVAIPQSYTANGSPATNGAEITGDPGAANEYDFSLSLQFPANATVEEISRVLKVTAEGGQEAQIDIKQAAGDAFITVEPTEITLEADGTAVSVTVKSNTQWSAS